MLHSIEAFLQTFRIATSNKPEIRLEVIIGNIELIKSSIINQLK